jgi:hypothetical protein
MPAMPQLPPGAIPNMETMPSATPTLLGLLLTTGLIVSLAMSPVGGDIDVSKRAVGSVVSTHAAKLTGSGSGSPGAFGFVKNQLCTSEF